MNERFTNFNPERVARLEAKMWEDYYLFKNPTTPRAARISSAAGLFTGLVTLTEEQFGLGEYQAVLVSMGLFSAATLFGITRHNQLGVHEKIVLPTLQISYQASKRFTYTHFNPSVAARHELGWWTAHRQTRINPDAKDRATREMALLFAEIYQVSNESTTPAAQLRIDAAMSRDQLAAARSLTENDWSEIQETLTECYVSLRTAATK